MAFKLKRDWDGLLALGIFILSSIGQFYSILEGMKLSKWIFFSITVLSIFYFLMWIIVLRRKRHTEIITSQDSFSERDYYNRTGISGMRRPHWRPKPWPRPRDQWNTSRGTWDTEVPPDRRNRE